MGKAPLITAFSLCAAELLSGCAPRIYNGAYPPQQRRAHDANPDLSYRQKATGTQYTPQEIETYEHKKCKSIGSDWYVTVQKTGSAHGAVLGCAQDHTSSSQHGNLSFKQWHDNHYDNLVEGMGGNPRNPSHLKQIIDQDIQCHAQTDYDGVYRELSIQQNSHSGNTLVCLPA